MKKDRENMSLGDLAEEALKKAVAGVVEEHRKLGMPLAVWRDGKVVRVPADQLQGYEEAPGSESVQARDEGRTLFYNKVCRFMLSCRSKEEIK